MIQLQVFGICVARGVDIDTAQDISRRAGKLFGKLTKNAPNDALVVAWLAVRLRTYEEDK